MSKDILFDAKARAAILRGMDALANVVKVTLGPKGRNVVIDRSFGAPIITKDGVTVAKEVEVSDVFENMGAQMLKEVASKTAEVAGDGTTTATVLAQAIYRAGTRLVAAGHDPMDIQRGIEKAVAHITKRLEQLSTPIQNTKEIAQVGTISANGDTQLGNLIAEAMDKVGREGVITVEEGKVLDTRLEVVEGMRFDRGYLSPYFVTNPERMEVVLEDAYVLIRDKKIASMVDLVPLLEQVARAGKPLLVIADDVEAEALATLVVNKLRGTLQVAAVKAPGYGEGRQGLMEDLAIVTGGQAISEDLGTRLADVTLAELGRARRVTITREHTTIVDGAGEKSAIAARLQQLQTRLAQLEGEYDRENMEKRIAKLSGGVAVIRVGAATEPEMKERKARVDDALSATRAAALEGIVPGGGVALVRCIEGLDQLEVSVGEKAGVDVLRRALEEPLRRIAENGGVEGSIVVRTVLDSKEPNFGYNAATGVYEDLVKAGVIDPTKVARVALCHAASIASLMLTTEAMVGRHTAVRASTSGLQSELSGS